MKKLIFVSVIVLSLISISSTNAFGQTLYVDANLGELKKIEESKYIASALSVIRNSEGELISVIETKATRYLAEPITEQYLDTLQVIKKGTINGKNVKMMQVTVSSNFAECTSKIIQTSGYVSACNSYNRPFVTSLVVTDDKNNSYEIFRGLNHGYVLKPLETVTTHWTIISNN